MTMLIRYGHNTPPLIPPMLLKIRLNFVQFAVIQNFLNKGNPHSNHEHGEYSKDYP